MYRLRGFARLTRQPSENFAYASCTGGVNTPPRSPPSPYQLSVSTGWRIHRLPFFSKVCPNTPRQFLSTKINGAKGHLKKKRVGEPASTYLHLYPQNKTTPPLPFLTALASVIFFTKNITEDYGLKKKGGSLKTSPFYYFNFSKQFTGYSKLLFVALKNKKRELVLSFAFPNQKTGTNND